MVAPSPHIIFLIKPVYAQIFAQPQTLRFSKNAVSFNVVIPIQSFI